MTIKLVGIGGMGLMMSPSAKHLKPGSPARYLRIHDRGTKDDRRDACRQAWKNHGAEIVHDYVWQVAFLFILCLMWLFWIDMVVKREKVPTVSA